MTIRQFLLACFCCVTPCLTAQTSKIKLSEMNLSSIYQPYGTPASGKAVTGEPLQVAGTLFADGVGVQANSKIKISLQGKSKSRKTKSDGREKRKAIFEAKTKCAQKSRLLPPSGQNTSVVQTPFKSCLNDAFLLNFLLKYHLKPIANLAKNRIFT